ncbi:glycosyltransferase family 4 protein [Actinoalloteichus spitiensis]|uniref:glycosyltransferase family 4 protein n=1 Tax=Actinoalloteichus spitiensis TaxID=252394 RepID=UPI0012F6AC16|nr:glycosyltransferase family 4 protein [Actinoalloteichus spitiensis]
MSRGLTLATLSKYPPYRSGHAQQALWNNRALARITGNVQHQVTYCGTSHDPRDHAGNEVLVHHVGRTAQNRRAVDGHLVKAMSAELVRVCLDFEVDALLTYYVDPHAGAANRAARALARYGKRPAVVHSIEGSDVLNSICEHVDDKQAALLIADFLDADVLCSVSRYTADRFVRAVESSYGGQVAEAAAKRIHIRYPGLPDVAFTPPARRTRDSDLASLGLDPQRPIVSSIGRLSPEKGNTLVVDVAEFALFEKSPVQFVIAGSGEIDPELKRRREKLPNLFVMNDVSSTSLHSLRAASTAALLPTREVPGFTETFCISALEYAALGVPVLATRLGGVPEAVPDDDFLAETTSLPSEWWARLKRTLARREYMGEVARAFARSFDDTASASRIIELTTTSLVERESA